MNARFLFTAAAIFNVLVGLGLLLAYDLLRPWLGLPATPTVWIHIVALIVLIFGYAYWRIATDPVRFREYVVLGIVAKLAFAAAIYGHYLSGDVTAAMAGQVSTDVLFAALFATYLKGTAADRGR